MATDGTTPQYDLSSLKIDDRDRSTNSSHRSVWIVIAVLIIISGLAAFAFFRNKSVEVEIITAREVGVNSSSALLNASGYVTPRRRATVAAKVTAQVKDIFVEEGLFVEENQVLATLDDADAQLQLSAAEAERTVAQAAIEELRVNIANAERELRRNRELYEKDVISVESLDQAKTTVASLKARLTVAEEQVKAAETRVNLAKQNLDNYTVRAPFSGIVVSKDAQSGEMVSPMSSGGFTRTGIATIVDMESLEIEVDVNESYIARVQPNQKVEATLDAYPDWRIAAKVRAIIPTADRQKATVKVRIVFDQLDPRILPDMGVRVAFLAEEEKKTQEPVVALALIPQQAIQEYETNTVVFLYHDGIVERRAVKLGAARTGDIEVLAGLRAGEQVVNNPPAGLSDKQRVSIKK